MTNVNFDFELQTILENFFSEANMQSVNASARGQLPDITQVIKKYVQEIKDLFLWNAENVR